MYPFVHGASERSGVLTFRCARYQPTRSEPNSPSKQPASCPLRLRPAQGVRAMRLDQDFLPYPLASAGLPA
jgi:hypothetical protein